MPQTDTFKMPEPERWLACGKAVLSPAANSWEDSSLQKQLEASGVFQSGLACVVDIVPFASAHGFAAGRSLLQPQTPVQDGCPPPVLGSSHGISDGKLFVRKIKLTKS